MSSLRQGTRQMLVYLSTLSLGTITFHRTYDKNILHILSVTNVLVYGGQFMSLTYLETVP